MMSYEERLKKYEADKQKVREQNLSYFEYLRAIKELADKWRI